MQNSHKIKRFIDCFISTETCNFRCHYCYIAQQKRFNNKIFDLNHSTEEVRRSLSKERLGGICLINLCAGGETLLSPNVLPIVRELLDEGHYVMIVTNGSITNRFIEIRDKFTQNQRNRLFFKFSFHYLELKRLKLIEAFFSNIRMVSECGCSFTCELVPNDDLIPYINEIKEVCNYYLGALCHVTIARDDRTGGISHLSKLSYKDFIKTWEVFDSQLFDFKKSIFYVKRKEFCYAGDWTIYLDLETGDYQHCNCGKKIGNIYYDSVLKFEAIGKCLLPHCYNGHVWLTLGTIENFTKTSYLDIRDRLDEKSKHWISPIFADFINQKLENNNLKYSEILKKQISRKANLKYFYSQIKYILKKIKKRAVK